MKAGLAAKEPAILERWARIGLYEQLREQRAGRERFILHDGPPYANGDIHMGHAMNKVLKDIVVRSQSLLGKDAPYVPGWDCHGLPIEWKVEEAYRAKKLEQGRGARRRSSAPNAAPMPRNGSTCSASSSSGSASWATGTIPYLTMKYEAEATIVGELLKFAESGQLYRGAKPVMWSPVEKTALAEAEVEYEDIVSTQIDVAFEIVEAPNAPELVGAHAVIWTTTPWTIPVNQALAYGPEIEYVVCVDRALRRAGSAASPGWSSRQRSDRARSRRASGIRAATMRDAAGRCYRAARTSPAPSPATRCTSSAASSPSRARFLPGDFVTTDAGTGLVHMAPDHGEDDFLLCKAIRHRSGLRGRRRGHVPRRLGVARRAGQRHQQEVQRARRADLHGSARGRRAARRERRLHAQLSA